MMRTIVEGDNGESKLVFVLHSRHEALVGTMGDPVLQTLASTLARCRHKYNQKCTHKYMDE